MFLEQSMPFHFLSLKELAVRVVLKEDVPFQALPQKFPLRRMLDKLSTFPGDYKLIETRPERLTKTGGGVPTPEEINRIKSSSDYRLLKPTQLPSNTLSISKAAKPSAYLWLVKFSSNDLLRLPSRFVTHTSCLGPLVVCGSYMEEYTEIADGNVSYKNSRFDRSPSTSDGDKPSISVEEEWLFEMEDANKMMKVTVNITFHKIDPDIGISKCHVFQRN